MAVVSPDSSITVLSRSASCGRDEENHGLIAEPIRFMVVLCTLALGLALSVVEMCGRAPPTLRGHSAYTFAVDNVVAICV